MQEIICTLHNNILTLDKKTDKTDEKVHRIFLTLHLYEHKYSYKYTMHLCLSLRYPAFATNFNLAVGKHI